MAEPPEPNALSSMPHEPAPAAANESAPAAAPERLDSRTLAQRARANTLRMVHRARAAHIGSCLSVIDVLAVLYADVLRVSAKNPQWPERDRFVLSKGHAAAALYAILAERGFFPLQELPSFAQDGSRLLGHASHHVPGVELSTGSLGHGLPVACGLALGLRGTGRTGLGPEAAPRVVCVLGDGELNEGSTWEALLFAPHHRLSNLVAIIDHNRFQSLGRTDEVLNLHPLPMKLKTFGWDVKEVDGHDHDQLRWALKRPNAAERGAGGRGMQFGRGAGFGLVEAHRPLAVIAHTIKGKGIDFMEERLEWHYRAPNDQELAEALRQCAPELPKAA